MYTVKQISQLSGLTPRTLHYYDQIGLLKPVSVGWNGYRRYDETSLLRLQQILLYREMGLPLKSIRAILDQPNFDMPKALEAHAAELQKRIIRLERLVATVDKTLLYLKGKQKMNKASLFQGFSKTEQKKMEKEAMRTYDPAIVKASLKKWGSYTQDEKQRVFEEGNKVYLDFIAAIPFGAASREAQVCVERWRSHMDYFWTPNEEQLLAIAEGYVSDARFRANFDQMDPRLAEFVRDAVKSYLKI